MNSDLPNLQRLETPGRIGFKIEQLDPKERSRKDLAEAFAEQFGGRVRRFFHPQGEISKAARTPFFENLTLGFVVEDQAGETLAQCVDDFTLQEDLDQKHPPQPDWYRIVSDDACFLRLMMQHADATEAEENKNHRATLSAPFEEDHAEPENQCQPNEAHCHLPKRLARFFAKRVIVNPLKLQHDRRNRNDDG